MSIGFESYAMKGNIIDNQMATTKQNIMNHFEQVRDKF